MENLHSAQLETIHTQTQFIANLVDTVKDESLFHSLPHNARAGLVYMALELADQIKQDIATLENLATPD